MQAHHVLYSNREPLTIQPYLHTLPYMTTIITFPVWPDRPGEMLQAATFRIPVAGNTVKRKQM